MTILLASSDDIADASVFSAFHHVQENFITSQSKLKMISNIDIEHSKYAYLIGGWVAHLAIHLFYWIHAANVNKGAYSIHTKLFTFVTMVKASSSVF